VLQAVFGLSFKLPSSQPTTKPQDLQPVPAGTPLRWPSFRYSPSLDRSCEGTLLDRSRATIRPVFEGQCHPRDLDKHKQNDVSTCIHSHGIPNHDVMLARVAKAAESSPRCCWGYSDPCKGRRDSLS